jgi:hypothetical protein
MFRTDLLSITKSLNSVFVFVFFILVMLTVYQQTVNITSMTNTSCCEYSIKTPDDGQQVCPKHVELYIKIELRISASRWLLLYEEGQY